MDELELRTRIDEALSTIISEAVTYELKDGVVTLLGTVYSEDELLSAEEQVKRVPGVTRVINRLRVELVEPLEETPRSMAGEFDDFEGPVVNATEDLIESVEWAEPYFPPVDPVVKPAPNEEEGLEVLGGFAESNLEEPFGTPEHVFPPESDEEICEEIGTLISRDSTTAYLDISVECDRGVVTLRGSVPTLEDAETAEWMAYRVPGVVEVHDEIEVQDL